MAVAYSYTISAKQRAIEPIGSIDIHQSDIWVCLNKPYFSRFAAPREWYGWVHNLVGAAKML